MAEVTRGKIEGPWLGGKGYLTPFRPKPTASPATQSPQQGEALDILAPGQEDPEPAMKGARIALEAALSSRAEKEFAEEMAARAAQRQSTGNTGPALSPSQASTTPEPSDPA